MPGPATGAAPGRPRRRHLDHRPRHHDLVTATTVGDRAATRREWDRQLAANLGLLAADEFEFMRPGARPDSLVPGTYRGLSLPDDILADVLTGNARRWLARCLR